MLFTVMKQLNAHSRDGHECWLYFSAIVIALIFQMSWLTSDVGHMYKANVYGQVIYEIFYNSRPVPWFSVGIDMKNLLSHVSVC